MKWMTFGEPNADLMPGARNAVEVCLAIKPGESVALIADEASRQVAASLNLALNDQGADVRPLCSNRLRHGRSDRRRRKCWRRSK